MEWMTGKHPRLRGRHLKVGPALSWLLARTRIPISRLDGGIDHKKFSQSFGSWLILFTPYNGTSKFYTDHESISSWSV